jgi:hypothetical protein
MRSYTSSHRCRLHGGTGQLFYFTLRYPLKLIKLNDARTEWLSAQVAVTRANVGVFIEATEALMAN